MGTIRMGMLARDPITIWAWNLSKLPAATALLQPNHLNCIRFLLALSSPKILWGPIIVAGWVEPAL